MTIFNCSGEGQTQVEEPVIDLAKPIEQACEEATLDLPIDYGQPPMPALSGDEQRWLKTLNS